MQPVIYSLIHYRGNNRIAVQFEYNKTLNARLQKVPGARWSKTLGCWHIPDTPENRVKCGLLKNGAAVLAPLEKTKDLKIQNSKAVRVGISGNNKVQLQLFLDLLKLKAYSSSTIKTYRNEFAQLLQAIQQYPVQNLTAADLKRYLLKCIDQGLTENTIHSRLNALKFYYEQVLHKEKFFLEIPRPKKPLILPKLLNEYELQRLFNALPNRKHKAMLFTAYSAGLRVSEISKLKLAHIDSQRMQIFVEKSKGKKDRYVNLSPILLDILRKYIQLYKPRPKIYLFESEQTFGPYPTRTIQQVFINAKNKAGINKDIGIHSLRHSFATHLLEKGTDIKYIKELLGHFNIRTTERYLHVSKQKLVNIISPFDDLWDKGSIEW